MRQKRMNITQVGNQYVVNHDYYGIETKIFDNFNDVAEYLKLKFEGINGEEVKRIERVNRSMDKLFVSSVKITKEEN